MRLNRIKVVLVEKEKVDKTLDTDISGDLRKNDKKIRMKEWFKLNGGSLFVAIFFLLMSLIVSRFDFSYSNIILVVLFYMSLYGAVGLLPKNDFTIWVVHIIRFPLYLVLLVDPLVKVAFFVFFGIIIPFTASYGLFGLLLEKIIPDFSQSTLWYLSFISATIFLRDGFEWVLSRLRKTGDSIFKMKLNSVFSLSVKLINNNKIRMIIYLLYFPFLIFFSLIQLEGFNGNREFFLASFYAFATFLAYDNIRKLNLEGSRFDWKGILLETFRNTVFYQEHKKYKDNKKTDEY